MSPRSADQNLALREASKRRILDAALRLFSRQGYASTTIRAIAREAGLAQGLLYSHFQGKEDLLRELFLRSMDDVRESFSGGPDKRPPLERLVHSGIAVVRRNLDFWRLSYGVRMQEGVVAVLGPDLQSWTREILETLEAIFRKSGSKAPALDDALFFAAFDGICQHYALDPDRYPLDKVAAALIDRFAPHSNRGTSHGKKQRR